MALASLDASLLVVARHLRRGEFLLLIIGDGIREGVESIVDFVQRHSGLHFNLALVEAALYRDTQSHHRTAPHRYPHRDRAARCFRGR